MEVIHNSCNMGTCGKPMCPPCALRHWLNISDGPFVHVTAIKCQVWKNCFKERLCLQKLVSKMKVNFSAVFQSSSPDRWWHKPQSAYVSNIFTFVTDVKSISLAESQSPPTDSELHPPADRSQSVAVFTQLSLNLSVKQVSILCLCVCNLYVSCCVVCSVCV